MSLLGPDGLPIGARKVRAANGMVEVVDAAGAHRASPEQVLMSAARLQRDGKSLEAIMDALDLVGDARNPFLLQRALDRGHVLLQQAIERGEEPAETHDIRAAAPYEEDDDD